MKQYEDILHLPHPTSEKYPRMKRSSRAAQFASFSALAGYEEAISKTAKMVEERAEDTFKEEDVFP